MTFHGTFHGAFALALLLDQAGLGLWGLILGLRRRPIVSAFYSALVVNEVLLLAEDLLGLVLFATGHGPKPVHFLYGALLGGLLPVAYVAATRRSERPALWLGLTLLFMAGLVLRAASTG